MAASAHGNRSVDPAPLASRRRLSRRDWQEIRRAADRFRNDDDVYSVSRHGVSVVFVRHNLAPQLQQSGHQQQQQRRQGEGVPHAPHAPTCAGNRQQKRAERSAERARVWHAEHAAQRSGAAQRRQGNQPTLMQQPQPPPTEEATQRVTMPKRTAEAPPPQPTVSSEPQDPMEAGTAQAMHAAHAQERSAHRGPDSRSPGGGTTTASLQTPNGGRIAAAGGPPRPFAAGSVSVAGPAQVLAPTHTNTFARTRLEWLRQQEFPMFMSFHMQQGVPERDARMMWDAYEHRCMSA